MSDDFRGAGLTYQWVLHWFKSTADLSTVATAAAADKEDVDDCQLFCETWRF